MAKRIEDRFGYWEDGKYHDRRTAIKAKGHFDLLGYYNTTSGKYETHKAHFAKPSVPVSRRIGHAWRTLNKPRAGITFHPISKKAVFLLLILALGVIFLSDQAFKPRDVQATHLAKTTMWRETLSDQLDPWNTQLASYVGTSQCADLEVGGASNEKVIRLDNNSTHSAVALTKVKVDFSIAVGKILQGLNTICFNSSIDHGMFLTSNGTIPKLAAYDPRDDPSVVLLAVAPLTQSQNTHLFMQREPGQTFNQATFDCSTRGVMFACDSGSAWTGDGTTANRLDFQLNYTGGGANSILDGGSVGGGVTVTEVPWFQVNGVAYYVGLWQLYSAGSSFVDFKGWLSNAFSLEIAYLASQPVTPNPGQVETSGFFGPLISGLVKIGVIAFRAIAQFLGWVLDAFVTAMDAVGGFFGIGTIGTQIRNALVGVATWVTNVFGTIFGQSVSIATAIANALSALVQVTGVYWTQLTSWLSAISNLLSLFWPFISFFGVGIPFSALMTYWLIQGIIMSYNSRDGAFQWMRWTWILSATLFNIMWAIGERAFDVILNVKRLLAQWL